MLLFPASRLFANRRRDRQRDEGMRTDQQPACPEELVVPESIDDSSVRSGDRSTPE
jgi:hypothetical protein